MNRLAKMHAWDVSAKQAIAIQKEWAGYVIIEDALPPIHTIAGVDVGFENEGEITKAAVAVLSYPALELLEFAIARVTTRFPYIPGLLSFREIPAVLNAINQLKNKPDLLMCDGQGYAHPRRFGIACHLGTLLDIPAIGVGKTRLIGEYSSVPAQRGQWAPLTHKNEQIGAVLRTREKIKPVFVSVGHRISLIRAIHYVMACTTRYKLPEAIRHAHRLASQK